MLQNPESPLQSKSNEKHSTIEILWYIILISAVLYFGKSLFIPLSFSLLISFILYPICKRMEKKGINQSISIFFSIFGLTLLFAAIIYLLLEQLVAFSHEWQTLEIKLLEATNQLSIFITQQFDISTEKQLLFLKNAVNNSGLEFLTLLKNTAYSFTESAFFILMIPIFSALILYYRQMLLRALYQIFPSVNKKIINEILIGTIHEYYSFIKGMLVVYLIVGTLNSLGLLIIGVPHPFLFGFIASILTFIPYIGIMISSLLPITVSWITFNSIWYPLGVVLIFSTVQVLEAYIIFPFAVGNRLKINTLAILVMVIGGGIIWGAAGMILFIPFASILKLIADRTKSLKIISLLLGEGKSKKGQY